jgi:peptidoglycan-associated lipoprotein
MNQLTKIGLTLLTAVALCSVGCKKKPSNITPLPGAGQSSAPTTSFASDPIRTTRPSNTGLPPGNAFQPGNDSGSRAVPFDPNAGTQKSDLSAPLGGTDANPGPRPSGDKPEDRETLKGDTVYFEYDKSAIKSSEYAKIAAVAEYLKSNSGDDLVVEGHCDERGTEEYNRALGERRALAVRERLVNLGVPASRVTTISYGKDRPVDVAHSEDAYSKNRRGEFVLLKGGAAVK